MKNALCGIAMLLVTGAAPVFAQDGRVADSTLSALGLGGMQVVSDAEGMQVRGMSSASMSMGTSLIFGQIIDPHTKSFISGSDVNLAGSSSENGGSGNISSASQIHSSAMEMELDLSKFSGFEGKLFGVASGHGSATNFFFND